MIKCHELIVLTFVQQRSDWAETGAVQNQLHARHQCSVSTVHKSFLCWIRKQSQR